jgi:hypothetical protein
VARKKDGKNFNRSTKKEMKRIRFSLPNTLKSKAFLCNSSILKALHMLSNTFQILDDKISDDKIRQKSTIKSNKV